MIRTLLFDLGNVLVGLEFERAYRAASALSGLSPDRIRDLLRTSGLAGPYERGEIDSAEFHRRTVELLGLEIDFERFAALWGDMFADRPLIDDALIDQAAARCRMAILSNTNELHFLDIRRRYPLLGKFEHYVLSYQVGAMKPSARIYEAALEMTDSRPEECFFTDDKPENIAGARKLGIDAELFRGEDDLREHLRRRGVLDA